MEQQITSFEALKLAVDKAGGQTGLARICGLTQPAVWKWLQSSKHLPAEYVLAVEAATGVSRHLLRPDIYPLSLPDHVSRIPRPLRNRQCNRNRALDKRASRGKAA